MASDKRAARLGVLALVAVLLFGALGTRLWFLQTVEAPRLAQDVEVERTKTVRLIPERGRIFDADGRILADNERILTIGIDWDVMSERSDRRALFQRLSGWIDVPVAEMERRFNARVYSPYVPMPVKEDVDEPVANALRERSEDFPGVQVVNDWRRRYPYAPLASPVLGYLGSIPEDTADEYVKKGYVLNERVGKDGLELSMEEVLHGRWGQVKFRVNAAGQVLDRLSYRAPVNGQDIQLAIDLDVQQYAESILQTQLQFRRNFTAKNPIVEKVQADGSIVRGPIDPDAPADVPYKAPAGSVVVMDQTNGQVAAMATYPNFDNRWFNAGVSSKKFAQLFPPSDTKGFDPDTSTLVNRAVQGQYNLGSTFKPFTAYAALNSGFMGVNDLYKDKGTYTMRSIDQATCDTGVRCVFRNSTCGGTTQPCVYGSVNVLTALAVSSDTFFYRIGEELFLRKRTLLGDEVKKWGFGSETGVDLPFEFDGRVPDDEVKRQLIESGALGENEVPRLVSGDNLQVAIGQGLMAASPIQLAQGYAGLGNGGVLNRPHLVRAIYEPGVLDATPGYADLGRAKLVKSYLAGEQTGKVEVAPEHLQAIIGGLRRNITGPGLVVDGNQLTTTAEEVFGLGDPEPRAIPVAGETGTAQAASSYPWEDSSAFAAFSMDETRPYTVAAYLEKSGYGSQGAAPVVKCMYLALSGLTVTQPVTLSDPLDIDSTEVAAPAAVAAPKCLKATNFDPTTDTGAPRPAD
ncbi:penicillin-binding protein 2 [soil metagenome]